METLKVLVIDDEPGMRLGVARALRDFQFSLPDVNGDVSFVTVAAEDAEKGLAMISEDRPDIVLLDHKLPGMSGLEALQRIVTGDGGPMVVMITAYASLEAAVSAIKHGAYDFLAKPFTPDELKNTVRKASETLILARQARKLAHEKRQVRFQFISVLAHELKAPLAAIEGYLHIIRDKSAGGDPAVYEHMVDRSLIRAEYMRKMIADLLDLTRIESGQRHRELKIVDLREAAKAAMETLLPAAQEMDVAMDLAPGAPAVLFGDRTELDIMLHNLVSNAVKYNRRGGKVDIAINADPDAVTVSVADTGIGMSGEEMTNLFRDFFRVKNEKTRNILGSGLGLSIVKKLATLYGGDVTVESEPGKGTTFTVTLKGLTPGADGAGEAASASAGPSRLPRA